MLASDIVFGNILTSTEKREDNTCTASQNRNSGYKRGGGFLQVHCFTVNFLSHGYFLNVPKNRGYGNLICIKCFICY